MNRTEDENKPQIIFVFHDTHTRLRRSREMFKSFCGQEFLGEDFAKLVMWN